MTTRADLLRGQLRDVTRLLETSHGAEEFSPEWMEEQSLRTRQAQLAHQLSMAEGSADVSVYLVGGAERDSEVHADFLGTFLREFQLTVSTMVQTLMRGESAGGRLPADVMNASSLRVAVPESGSFVVHMAGPERSVQLTLEEDDALPPFDVAVERVLTLLDAVSTSSETGQLDAAIAEIRSRRVLDHVQELAGTLARTGTSATVTGRGPFAQQREARLTPDTAGRLQQILSKTRQETERVFMTGQLSGIRWRRRIFDLEVPIGDAQEQEIMVISGDVSADLRQAVDALFDRDVRAELEHTRTWTEFSDEPRDTWMLVGVEPAG